MSENLRADFLGESITALERHERKTYHGGDRNKFVAGTVRTNAIAALAVVGRSQDMFDNAPVAEAARASRTLPRECVGVSEARPMMDGAGRRKGEPLEAFMPVKRVRPRSHPSRVQQQLPFGPAPVLQGEDSAEYDELLLRASSAVKPEDFIEEMLLRDIVDRTWDLRRLRRLKVSLISIEERQELQRLLNRLAEDSDDEEGEDESDVENGDIDDESDDEDDEDSAETSELVIAWARKKPGALKKVGAILAAEARSIDEITAQALVENLETIERFDRMIAMAEAHRNSALREIDRHRRESGARQARATRVDGDD